MCSPSVRTHRHTIDGAATTGTSCFAFDVDGDANMDALAALSDDDTVNWYQNDGS